MYVHRHPHRFELALTYSFTDLATAMLSKTLPLLVMNLEWHYTEPDKERKIRSTFMTRLETVMVQWKARAEIEKA